MNTTIRVYKGFAEHDAQERLRRQSMTPKERLDEVEILRRQGGKFIHEYPTRLRRIITVTNRRDVQPIE